MTSPQDDAELQSLLSIAEDGEREHHRNGSPLVQRMHVQSREWGLAAASRVHRFLELQATLTLDRDTFMCN